MSIEDRIRREAEELQHDWDTNPRWKGVRRDYTAEDVIRLRGSLRQDFAISRERRRAPVAPDGQTRPT